MNTVSWVDFFPEPEVARLYGDRWTCPATTVFAEVAEEPIRSARARINYWVSELEPITGRKSHITKSLRSKDDVNFFQALDELFVHHLLIAEWDDVRYEEEINGVAPDFRAYRHTLDLSVEVLTKNAPEAVSREDDAYSLLYDEINDAFPDQFPYAVDPTLHRYASTLDIAAVIDLIGRTSSTMAEAGDPGVVEVEHDAPGTLLVLAIYQKNYVGPTVLAVPGTITANAPKKIGSKISQKSGPSSNYALHGRPFVVVVGMNDRGVFLDADYQEIANPETIYTEPSDTRISGVVFLPSYLSTNDPPRIIENPVADVPLEPHHIATLTSAG